MDRRITMARFEEPNFEEPKVLGHCEFCNDDLMQFQEIKEIDDYQFFTDFCLKSYAKTKILEDE